LFRDESEESGTGPLLDPKELVDTLDPEPPSELEGAGTIEVFSAAARVAELESVEIIL